MNIFDLSPFSRILEDLDPSSDWESWWSEGVFQALQEEALGLQDESGELALDGTTLRTE
jgi:hypothetical protein